MGIDWVSLEWSTLKFFKALLDALFDFPVQLAEGSNGRNHKENIRS